MITDINAEMKITSEEINHGRREERNYDSNSAWQIPGWNAGYGTQNSRSSYTDENESDAEMNGDNNYNY